MMRKSLVAVFVILLTCDVSSQKLGHVLGEVLIEMPNEKSPHHLVRKYNQSKRFESSVKFRNIITEPMNIWCLSINPNIDNENDFLSAVALEPAVYKAQKNHITEYRAIPNDPDFSKQFQYINDGSDGGEADADLDMELAWDITTGGLTTDGDTIVVCVIDDGLNFDHPDMQGNIWRNHAEIPNNGIDDDNNGYIDDYNGWNVYDENDTLNIDGSHGTPVAGIIGARGNNMIGVSGVNWNVQTMIVAGGGPESNAIASYAYAYSHRKRYNDSDGMEGAFVVATNSSWGVDNGNPDDVPIWCEFYNLMGSVGIVSCGATTNSNTNVDVMNDLPTSCSSDFLISVTNVRRNDVRDNSAGFGLTTIDLGAFGSEVYTLTTNGYGRFGGTSAATPHVAGVVALAYATDCPDFMAHVKANPAQAALSVKDMLLYGVDANESLESTSVTGGRLNAHNALQNMLSLCSTDCSEQYGFYFDEVFVSTASASFVDYAGTGEVDLRYRVIGSDNWIVKDVNSSPLELISLEPCQSYEYQTATNCSTATPSFGFSKIFTTRGCCEEPTFAPVDVAEGVATVSWSIVLGADMYVVEYKKQTDQDWNTLTVDFPTDEITIPNVEDCNIYDLRLKALCDVSNRESDFQTTTFSGECDGCTADYCAISPKNTRDEWIEEVAIDGVFSNVSGDNMGFGNFIGGFDIELDTEVEYTLNLKPGHTAVTYAENWSAYIDYNLDGVFAEEELIYGNEPSTQNPVSGTFTIPATAVGGVTRMRVIMRFSESNEGPCENSMWIYGEYEDYCVEIKKDPLCPSVIEIESSIDSTVSELSFELSTNEAIEFYQVSYRPEGDLDYTTVIFDTPIINLSDLERCTNYEILYSASCNSGESESSETVLTTKCSTSTDSPESKDISIYPSPSTGLLLVDLQSNHVLTQIDIIAANGNIVLSKNGNFTNAKMNISEAANLKPGVYLVRMIANGKNFVKKWIKI